jgi:hypothetical protein
MGAKHTGSRAESSAEPAKEHETHQCAIIPP